MPFIYHENQIPLEVGSLLWRYMDHDKIESFLKNKALFFCRADKFVDPFEGSLPKREADYRIQNAKNINDYLQRPTDPLEEKKNIIALGELHKAISNNPV